jgi:hypothetical protein
VPPPNNDEVARITASITRRVEKLMLRRGLPGDDGPTDLDPREAVEPLLSQLYSASVQGRVATGPRAGQRLLRLGDRIDVEDMAAIAGPRCASVHGFSLHADVCVPAVARPPCYPIEEPRRAMAAASNHLPRSSLGGDTLAERATSMLPILPRDRSLVPARST